MLPDGSGLEPVSQSGWHSIRPWTPPLSLSVREITSVSATFILSSTLSDLGNDLEPTLVSLGLSATEDDEDHGAEGSSSGTMEQKKKSIISDALAKGLSVNVNGVPWQRVFIDDRGDEAVIIIYSLKPGRQYDIDLGLVHGDQSNKIRRQVVTEDAIPQPEVQTDMDSPNLDNSTSSSDPPVSTPSTSPNRTLPGTPPTTITPLTAEDRLVQLQHALTLLNTERDTLNVSLKTARRDGQKADAALRSEIEILKRTSEKNAATEHRSKQKILSLQEAVKRAQTSTREIEELVREVESVIPDLKKQREEKEEAYIKIKEEADRARKERDEEVEKEKKRFESMRGELSGLNNKLEKLNGKKDKLENSVILDLEEQLKELEREVERAEMDSYTHSHAPSGDQHEPISEDFIHRNPEEQSISYHSAQRMRHQSTNPGTIGRPSPASVQRPASNENILGHQNQLWSPPRQPQSHQCHNPRTPSLHQQTPTLLINPNRQSSLKSTTTSPPSYNASSSSTSSTSSPTTSNACTTTSTLSSRAPAFEPGRSLKTPGTTGTSSGYSVSPAVIQRPIGSASRGASMGNQTKPSVHTQWAGI